MARLTQDPERVNPVRAVHIWRTPPGSAVDMLIVTHLEAYSAMHEHATAALPNETGGFLIGRVAFDHRDGCWHIEIEEAVPVVPESQDPVHFTFTWRDVDRVRSYREGQGKALVGWFHTHPDLGIFLSDTDLERTHRVLFNEPFQVALVYDPVRGRAGYFFWEAAQAIDAAQAAWREFDIAVNPEDLGAEAVRPPTTRLSEADTDILVRPSTAVIAAPHPTPVPPSPRISAASEPAAAQPAEEPPTSATQFRRLREITADPVPPAAAGSSTPADAALDTSRMASPASGQARPSRTGGDAPPSRITWLIALLIVVVAVCGTVGYFWLSSVRGPQ